ncbi:MAG: hypothetical protein ACRD03_06370 [Acidimicrobiales bacterium]
MTAGPEELRPHVRPEPITGDELLVVRGGPDTAAKLAAHARRMHRAYVLDGEPLFGLSGPDPTLLSSSEGGQEKTPDWLEAVAGATIAAMD